MPDLLHSPKLPTLPARPVNGGPLEKADRKFGDWRAEPKFNGWRALLHVASGVMWNRHGARLSIEGAFAESVELIRTELAQAEQLGAFIPEFLDLEGLARRHDHLRGTLIVLDAPIPGAYLERRAILARLFHPFDYATDFAGDMVRLVPSHEDAPALYADLQQLNALYCPEWKARPLNAFFEGIVMKRVDSEYPLQLRNPSAEFPRWMKHRFA
jgi:hypothetical protein